MYCCSMLSSFLSFLLVYIDELFTAKVTIADIRPSRCLYVCKYVCQTLPIQHSSTGQEELKVVLRGTAKVIRKL